MDMEPLADKMHIARGPCCEKDIIFVVMSWKKTKMLSGKQDNDEKYQEIKIKTEILGLCLKR